jgi:BTB/POZ domain
MIRLYTMAKIIKLTLEDDDSHLSIFNTKAYPTNIINLLLKDNNEISIHDFIVSVKCDYFKSFLSNEYKESKSKEIVIHDINVKYLTMFLRLIYGNTEMITYYDMMGIYTIADRFGYKCISKLENIIIGELPYFDGEQTLLLLSMQSFDVSKILRAVPLKIMQTIIEDVEDIHIARLMFKEAVQRYKKLGQDFKLHKDNVGKINNQKDKIDPNECKTQ